MHVCNDLLIKREIHIGRGDVSDIGKVFGHIVIYVEGLGAIKACHALMEGRVARFVFVVAEPNYTRAFHSVQGQVHSVDFYPAEPRSVWLRNVTLASSQWLLERFDARMALKGLLPLINTVGSASIVK